MELRRIEIEIRSIRWRKYLNVLSKTYTFYHFQKLALIFLSPILATAVWFVLSQLGIQGQMQGTQSQTGIFIFAAVRFTIGLVTEEAILFLINNIKKIFGESKNHYSTGSTVEKKSF